MKSLKILVVGSINMDLILKSQRLPSAGEHLFCESYEYVYGGKGANQSIATAKFGAEVTLVGKVGDDAFGGEIISALNGHGVRTNYLGKERGLNTGLAVIILESSGQNRILIYPESNMKLKPSDVEQAFKEHYDGMILQFEVPQDVVIHSCQTAARNNIPFFVDAGPAVNFPIEEIQGAQVLSPNESETYAMTGIRIDDLQSVREACILLKERSKARYVVIKAGERGAFLYDGVDIKHFAPYKVSPIDPTAAGDAFTAAMTIDYLKSGCIEKAIKFANAAGAIAVTRMGAQPSMPTLEETREFMKT